MNYELCRNPVDLATQCLVIACFSDEPYCAMVAGKDKQLDDMMTQLRDAKLFTGEIGKSISLYQSIPQQAKIVLLLGCGEQQRFDTTAFLKMLKLATAEMKRLPVESATLCFPKTPNQSNDWELIQTVLAFDVSQHNFDKLKSISQPSPALSQLHFYNETLEPELFNSSVATAQAIAEGMRLCRDLGNLPSNICTPSYLAETAKQLATQFPHLTTQILEESDLEQLGMNALLAVAKGSEQRAKVVILHYQGTDSKQAPIVLVGKGITFDSGGISIKPADKMDEMKYDMCGAASVLGTLQAIAQLQLPINVIGALACCENLPSGQATKPGDIVKTHAGLTVEILNTDAEGRLVLCDVLSYVTQFNPRMVVDIATLTGSVIFALGYHLSGVMGNDETLIHDLITAGKQIEDKAWHLPMLSEYHEALDSSFADIANIASDRAAGAITAACFLSRFTEKYRWAHLDIAGTAWVSGKNKGATGRPIPLLTQFLINQSNVDNECPK